MILLNDSLNDELEIKFRKTHGDTRAYLDLRNFIRISHESNSYVLLTSHSVWNGGMKFSSPMEILAFLHEMEARVFIFF